MPRLHHIFSNSRLSRPSNSATMSSTRRPDIPEPVYKWEKWSAEPSAKKRKGNTRRGRKTSRRSNVIPARSTFLWPPKPPSQLLLLGPLVLARRSALMLWELTRSRASSGSIGLWHHITPNLATLLHGCQGRRLLATESTRRYNAHDHNRKNRYFGIKLIIQERGRIGDSIGIQYLQI